MCTCICNLLVCRFGWFLTTNNKVTRGYLPCRYRWLCLLFISHFRQPFHDFRVFYNCPLRSRLGFGPTNILLHWYLQYFLYLTTRSCFNCRSSFFSLVRERPSIHDCSVRLASFGKLFGKLLRQTNPKHRTSVWDQDTTRLFFEMQRLWQSFF